eukprot:307283-Rhodomonas_salina.1
MTFASTESLTQTTNQARQGLGARWPPRHLLGPQGQRFPHQQHPHCHWIPTGLQHVAASCADSGRFLAGRAPVRQHHPRAHPHRDPRCHARGGLALARARRFRGGDA